MPNLLIELFSEEIPARMQAQAAETLRKNVTDGLVEAGLTYAGAKAFSTPRRLTLAVEGLLGESPDIREERKGPKVGAPEKAIEGFLRGAGVSREALEERETPKGAVYFATIEKTGRPAEEIVAEVLEAVIRGFPWPKSMRWGAGSLRWVRPLHSILCLLDDESGARTVPLTIDGIEAGDSTEGHRFMSKGRFSVASFEDYEARLKRAHVLLDPEERADHIWQEATNRAFARGLEVVEDKGLLREVAGLVEWPVVLMGEIDEEFLELPPEVLQTSMKEHQKFFSVKSPKTGRIERFVTVANRETADNGATILAGNQKVLSARLADAKFFWENDLRVAKAGMEDWVDGLSSVTFHAKLGSQAERVTRIAALAREIAPHVGADPDKAEEAARIAKADLRSEMVGEFPELQGAMGRYYALEAGRDADVADACRDHWKPLGQDDSVPSAPVSVAVALADKIDTLTGFWAIDEKPTGSKDPYALRRAALGVIRLVLGNGIRVELVQQLLFGRCFDHLFSIKELHILNDELNAAMVTVQSRKKPQPESFSDWRNVIEEVQNSEGQIEAFESRIAAVNRAYQKARIIATNLLAFFHDRLKVHLKGEGIRYDVIDACLAMEGSDDLALLVKRAEALSDFLKTDDGENLTQGFKRANNILTQAEEKDGVEYSFGADIKFAETDAEKALFAALDAADARIKPAMEAEEFAEAMRAMASLRAPVDAFFEAVQINAESDVLRRNRLNLLSRIRSVCSGVADLSRLEG
ncbi:glycine--tRNA ligase subunit beta [Rhodobacteraceae bacterium 63075]|nr:glycine--tRNA ligase subunit beta [Rhodobacteraceae bacterium 63075]